MVDEASDESFPASDPPAYGSHHATTVENEPTLPTQKPRRLRAIIGSIAVGLVAIGSLFAIVQRFRRRSFGVRLRSMMRG